MADIEMTAAYASIVEDEGQLFVGFAEGEDEDEGYALFRQSVTGGPVWFEVTDEVFGGFDAVERADVVEGRLTIVIRPEMQTRFGGVARVLIHLGEAEGAAEAVAAVHGMLTQA